MASFSTVVFIFISCFIHLLHATSLQASRHDIWSLVTSDGISASYLIKLKIGSPPIEVIGMLDTGSDLIWFQCLPCDNCYNQNPPLFDPTKSTTYVNASCQSTLCEALPSNCEGPDACRYYYSYADDSNTTGFLASESFSFSSRSNKVLEFSGIVFGCGHNNSGTFPVEASGLVGLGRGPLSLISQLGETKFSYCLILTTSNSSGTLRIGKNASIAGENLVSTPMLSKKSRPSYYYVILEGVSVRGKKISNKNMPLDEGNIIMDSGATFTVLEEGLYNNLESMMRETIHLEPLAKTIYDSKLCYNKEAISNLNGISVTFHFRGADVVLEKENLFYSLGEFSCFSIIPATTELNIYGNVAQTNFHVEYDLKREVVSFVPRNCKSYHEDTNAGNRMMGCQSCPTLLLLILILPTWLLSGHEFPV